jgi:hypothetical protein
MEEPQELVNQGHIPKGMVKLCYTLLFQAPDHTMTNKECDVIVKNVLIALERTFGRAFVRQVGGRHECNTRST